MARTDIRAVDGLDGRDRPGQGAASTPGADAIFPEAMADLAEFEAVRAAVDVPILANMTEFGKSDLFTRGPAAGRRRQHRDLPGDAAAYGDGRGRARAGTITAEGTQEPQVGEHADPRAAVRAGRLRGLQPLRHRRLQLPILEPTAARHVGEQRRSISMTEHDIKGPRRRRGGHHRDLEGQPRDQLAAVPRLPGAGARRQVHLRGGRLPALARRAAHAPRAGGVRGPRARRCAALDRARQTRDRRRCRTTAHPMDVVPHGGQPCSAALDPRARTDSTREAEHGQGRRPVRRSCPRSWPTTSGAGAGRTLVEPRDDLGYSAQLPLDDVRRGARTTSSSTRSTSR